MSYDENIAARIRQALDGRPEGVDIGEKKMFGGLCFLVGGKMFCGLVGSDLMVRVGPDQYAAALGEPHVRPMDFTGRPMNGYVYVSPAGCQDDAALAVWLGRGLEFVTTLPVEKKTTKAKRKNNSA